MIFPYRILLALTCAALMASCIGSGEVTITADPAAATPAPAASAVATPAPVETPAAPPIESPAPTPTQLADERKAQVLVVTQTIPRGTSVVELLQAPTVYLSARAVRESDALPSAINSIAELQEFEGFVLSREVLPGEQLTSDSFRDPSNFASEPSSEASSNPAPLIVVDMPPEHAAEVIVLPPDRAVGGLVLAGEIVRIVATTTGSDGRASSEILLDDVEVVGLEALIDLGGDNPVGPFDLAITLALRPEELQALEAARAGEAILTLAVGSQIAGEHAIALEMSKAQALDGAVRFGDTANILAVIDPDNPTSGIVIATGVEVLLVSADFETESTYSVLISTADEELLAIVSAAQTGGVALGRP